MNLRKEVNKIYTQTSLRVYAYLSSHKCRVNWIKLLDIFAQNGNTALMEASESGHNAVVKTLVDYGADVVEKNKVCVCS